MVYFIMGKAEHRGEFGVIECRTAKATNYRATFRRHPEVTSQYIPSHLEFTAREIDILRLKEQSVTDREIARRLGISFATVKTILHNARGRHVREDGKRPRTSFLTLAASTTGLLDQEILSKLIREMNS